MIKEIIFPYPINFSFEEIVNIYNISVIGKVFRNLSKYKMRL